MARRCTEQRALTPAPALRRRAKWVWLDRPGRFRLSWGSYAALSAAHNLYLPACLGLLWPGEDGGAVDAFF